MVFIIKVALCKTYPIKLFKKKCTRLYFAVTYCPSTAGGCEVAEHVEGLHVVRLNLINAGDVEALHLYLVAIRGVAL